MFSHKTRKHVLQTNIIGTRSYSYSQIITSIYAFTNILLTYLISGLITSTKHRSCSWNALKEVHCVTYVLNGQRCWLHLIVI